MVIGAELQVRVSVRMLRLQLVMLPAWPFASSTTKRLHVPLGFVSLKTDNTDPPEGACVGNVSPAPTFVGLNVPVVSGPASDILAAALSSRFIVKLLTAMLPPTSD